MSAKISTTLPAIAAYTLGRCGEKPVMRSLCRCCRQFTDTAIGLSMVLLNAGIDLISFSGILYSIYPPLFVALLVCRRMRLSTLR